MTVDHVLLVVQILVGLGALGGLYRVIRGPTLTDRANALDVVLLSIASGVAAHGARTGDDVFTPLLIAVGLVAFLATSAVARYGEWRQDEEKT
ncbi:MAG: monovalent cation/H+ antiporter complex subunit F [Acidimicrobiia bacterium]|jgi:multicomponent Na+:H+ antiporter subunit F